MSRLITSRIVILIAIVAVVVTAVLIVERARPGVPSHIRIAAGVRGGLYYETAAAIAAKLESQTGTKVDLIASNGDLDNRRLLQTHKADIGLLQVSSDDVAGLVAVTPMYDEVVQIIVRKDRSIKSIDDLRGRNVALGPVGSGTRSDALRILQTYNVRPAKMVETASYLDLESDNKIDAAFITSGFLNPDVQRVMATGRYALIEIPNADAFIVRYPFYKIGTVPRGLYSSQPAIPDVDTHVLTVRCYLATQTNAEDAIVDACLGAIYAGNIRHQIPVLVSEGEAKDWLDEPMHPAAAHFFDPYSNLGFVSNVLQALSSLKELIVALATMIYVSYRLIQGRREAATLKELQRQKEHLDTLIEAVVDLDQRQRACEDVDVLQSYLSQAFELKDTALHDLTHETLRSNALFTVYFLQITNVIGSIEKRIIRLTGEVRKETFV